MLPTRRRSGPWPIRPGWRSSGLLGEHPGADRHAVRQPAGPEPQDLLVPPADVGRRRLGRGDGGAGPAAPVALAASAPRPPAVPVPASPAPAPGHAADQGRERARATRLRREETLLTDAAAALAAASAAPAWVEAVHVHHRVAYMSPDELSGWIDDVRAVTRRHVRRSAPKADVTACRDALTRCACCFYGYPHATSTEPTQRRGSADRDFAGSAARGRHRSVSARAAGPCRRRSMTPTKGRRGRPKSPASQSYNFSATAPWPTAVPASVRAATCRGDH